MQQAARTFPSGEQQQRVAELGFGCARLLMESDRKGGAVLLNAVLDAGIRHIDVARSYGDGRTEKVVGEVARLRRHEMIIVTKAGLIPPDPISRLYRKASRLAGRMQDAPARRRFHAASIMRSVEHSLRNLKTDYLDAVLLHDCTSGEISEELKATMLDLKRKQMVRAIGVATTAKEASAIAAAHPQLADIVQVEAASREGLRMPACTRVITHSVFADADALADPAELLKQALKENPAGVVLFSSSNVDHIQSNACLARSIQRLGALA